MPAVLTVAGKAVTRVEGAKLAARVREGGLRAPERGVRLRKVQNNTARRIVGRCFRVVQQALRWIVWDVQQL